MTDTPEAVPAHSMFKVLAALGALGDATAAAVAEHAGLGYSTATAKLRAWEQTGQAERFRTDDGRTLWRLTDTGRTATAHPDGEQPPPAPATTALPDHGEAADTPDQNDEVAAPPDDPPAASTSGQATGPDAPTTTPSSPGSGQETPAEPTPDAEQVAGSTAREARPDTARRAKGSLRGAVLDLLEAHPDRAYKTGEIAKLIDNANAGTGAAKASAGAVANAVTKLVAEGKAVQTLDRPATYQLAPTTGHQ
ncbi:MarR family transcriptional regulator [Micromonospora tulbaghiae]|uniref:MarR family transcriptional regulator n=1 Tax=Micromonospora tulbaghiae TaxID=479978 RepID=UPI003EBB792F